jgi:hypothetical protein
MTTASHANHRVHPEHAHSVETPNEAPALEESLSSAQQARLQQAEQMVDHLTERVGHFASLAGDTLLRWASRAREEAEDIWAEAQSLRRGERS